MIKVYSIIYMGQFNLSDPQVFGMIRKVSTDYAVGSIVEFRPLSEDEFNLVSEVAVNNGAKIIYSSYDESMKDSVEMRIFDGDKERDARHRAERDARRLAVKNK